MYISAPITNANPAATLYTAIAAALTAEGYTLIDTVVIGTRTHKIWQCLNTNNTFNLTWYLDVAYTTTGAGSVWFLPFEDYNAGTDQGIRGIWSSSDATTPDPTTGSRFGATGFALETNWAGGSMSMPINLLTTTSTYNYYISVTPERVIGMTTAEPTRVVYGGFYDPDPTYAAKAGAGLFPLVGLKTSPTLPIASSGTNSAATAALTRAFPHNSGTLNWRYHLEITPENRNVFWLPDIAAPDTTLIAQSVQPILLHTQSISGPTFFRPGVWGRLIDMAAARAGVTVGRGDITPIDSEDWVLSSGTAGLNDPVILFKAA